MPGVTDDDWLVRLRKHLGIVPKSVVEKIPQPIRTKPIELDPPLASSVNRIVHGLVEG